MQKHPPPPLSPHFLFASLQLISPKIYSEVEKILSGGGDLPPFLPKLQLCIYEIKMWHLIRQPCVLRSIRVCSAMIAWKECRACKLCMTVRTVGSREAEVVAVRCHDVWTHWLSNSNDVNRQNCGNVREVGLYYPNEMIPYPDANILHCVTVLKRTVVTLFIDHLLQGGPSSTHRRAT